MKGLIAALGFIAPALIVCCAADAAPAAEASLVVHEWGTFTSFQDLDGSTIPGINVDDEPVPSFVHRLSALPILTDRREFVGSGKGAGVCHKDVTLRLETPVLYFYPSPSFRRNEPIDVQANFPGGWLTEYFPNARTEVPGFPDRLSAATQGSLKWSDLRLIDGALTSTTETVWLAPRSVQSAVVSNADGKESEKYLFYRGVGHVNAPLVTQRAGDSVTIALRNNEAELDQFPQAWLVRVRSDGRVWYRSWDGGSSDGGRVSISLADSQAADARGLGELRDEISRALISRGLYADEAQAMLNTWQKSYFASAGLRLFFLLPQTWTDAHLPLSLSVPADISRVMMGRIELISPEQQAALDSLRALPESALDVAPYEQAFKGMETLTEPESEAQWQKVMKAYESRPSLFEAYRALGLKVPESARLYESLGRFRDPLLGYRLASATEPDVRARLEIIIRAFSVCVPPFSPK